MRCLDLSCHILKTNSMPEKIDGLNNIFPESTGKGHADAFFDIKGFSRSFDPNKQEEFNDKLKKEISKARAGIRRFRHLFLNRNSEAGKVKDLAEEVEVYLKKVKNSTSDSKIQRAGYATGQALFAKSVDEQYKKVLKTLR